MIVPLIRGAAAVPFERRALVPRLFQDRSLQIVAFGSLVVGIASIVHYARLNLLLSHYDARAHLVVARRIIDNLSPCWEQIGAVWLPLPHVLNALPVQIDAWYRTGASAIAISAISFVVTACAVFLLARHLTGSRDAGTAAAALAALNPNLLYLQSTPMTEPLFMALTTTAVVVTIEATLRPRTRSSVAAGVLLAAACLTRYEAWPVAVAAVVLMTYAAVGGRRGVVSQVLPMAALPIAAIAAFCLHSKLSTGAWFVTDGFYVPENEATGRPFVAAVEVWWGTYTLTGYTVLIAGVGGAILTLIRSISSDRRRRAHAIALALAAAAALPTYAFYQGHPFRVRYMTPLIPVVAVFAPVIPAMLGPVIAAVLGPLIPTVLGRGRPWLLALLVALAVVESPAWSSQAAMVREAQWDVPASRARHAVSTYLSREYDGRLIMASMGSLGHYMQELARIVKPPQEGGFNIADFLHEGNGDIWTAALEDPTPHAGWLLVDEFSEGGDVLAALARTRPAFLTRYAKVAAGGGVVLYRRRTPDRVSESERK